MRETPQGEACTQKLTLSMGNVSSQNQVCATVGRLLFGSLSCDPSPLAYRIRMKYRVSFALAIGLLFSASASCTVAVEEGCQDAETAGQIGTRCGVEPGASCNAGLICDYGCTDVINECGGICRDERDPDIGCRAGECDTGDDCGRDHECREDNFCYPIEF